jgi:hypothetical protein
VLVLASSPDVLVALHRGSDRALQDLAAKIFGAVGQLLVVDLPERFELKIEALLITDFSCRKIVGYQTEGRVRIPGRINRLFDSNGLESVLFEQNFTRAVVVEWHRHGRVSDRLVIDGDGSAFGETVDLHLSAHAA